MPRQRSPKMKIQILNTCGLFIVVSTFLVASAAPLKQEGTSHLQPESPLAFAPAQVRMSAQTPTHRLGATNIQRVAGRPGYKSKAYMAPLVPGGFHFLPAVVYDSGGFTEAGFVTVADVNGDGIPDLLVANSYYSNTIGVLLGNGDGSFRPVVTYGSGGGFPMGIVVVDIDGDGRLDLIVMNQTRCYSCSGDGLVAVLLGRGDGTFGLAETFDSGGIGPPAGDLGPDPIAVVDVNGDGKLDVVVVNCAASSSSGCGDGDGAVGVLLGNGDGTFRPVVTYDAGAAPGGTGLAVGELNGDGQVDLVVTHTCGNSEMECLGGIGVLLGNGDGTFRPSVNYALVGFSATGIALADLNLDGKLDVVVGGCGSSNCWGPNGIVNVLLGNGDGTFGAPIGYDSGGRLADGVAVSDVNGDGKLDVVVTDTIDSSVAVLQGNGDGTFLPAVTFASGAGFSYSVAVADVNADGQPDLLVTSLGGSVSVLINDSAALLPTTTSLISSSNHSIYGQPVTFTATVRSSSGMPTGAVILYDGTTAVGTGTLSSGKTSILVYTLPVGSNSVTATYLGNASFGQSTSAPLAQTVAAATTTTKLTSSLNPAGTNQSVTFTATVASQYGGAATGSVVFSSGSQSLGTVLLSGNTAVLTTSFSTKGTYSISAKYNGDGNNSGSTSSNLREVILAATTTTLVSSLNPSPVGQAVTFTATVGSSSGTPPNGETITFKNGSAVLGTAPLGAGKAALTTSTLAAGIYTITASYPGDSNFEASTSPVLRQVVNSTTKSATATTLISSLNPSIYGQKVTWTATVTTSGSVPPTGAVNFTWGHSIGTATLNASGVATLTKSNLNADTYPLTAVYGGDVNNLSSNSPVVIQVITQATSSATLTSSPNPSTFGQVVTFTATITSPTVIPNGPVTFAIGNKVLGTAQLSAGKASFTTSTLAVGSTKVTATYNGNSNVANSSASVTQTVH